MHVHAKKDITVQLASKRWDLTERIPRASVQGMDTLLRITEEILRIFLIHSSGSPVSATKVGFPTLATMHVPVKLVLIHHAPNVHLDITYLTERATCAQAVPSRVPVICETRAVYVITMEVARAKSLM